MKDELDKIIEKATIIHLQPDDVLVFSNMGDTMGHPEEFERLGAILGDRRTIGFAGPVEVNRLRDLLEDQ
jgi:hypothetical protein